VVRAALGDTEAAASLLVEVEETPDLSGSTELCAYLPMIVRTALEIGEPELAERLGAHLEPRTPYAEHSLVAVQAALAEARGETQAAEATYADAADRWKRFGVVPEQAFALLGQGRCLIGLSRPTEAAAVLQHAREIFEPLRSAPALAETDTLLQRATAISS
jgi:ATP/maltotriose-dependent transcriptional regulator MalT